MKTNKLLIFAISTLLLGSSCSDGFMDVTTTATLTSEDAATTMETDPTKLDGFVSAIYSLMIQSDLVTTDHDAFGFMSILHSTDMMGQDIVQSKSHWFTYDYTHTDRNDTYRRTRVDWTYLYTMIADANIVLGMTSAESTSPDVLAYRGQSLALRGMAYYYLVQLYQHTYKATADTATTRPGIPLYYATNEGKENVLGRAPVKDVLAQIESDLTMAVVDLKDWNRTTKNQVDYYVANGLLARYYLLTEQWAKAVDAAEIAAGNFEIMSTSDLHDGFMDINNAEGMWGFDENSETQTTYASFFSHISNITPGYAGLNYAPRLIDKDLYDQISSTDERKTLFQGPSASITAASLTKSNMSDAGTSWTLPYADLKFGWDGAWTMDYMYMRAAEMVLIQAEALAQQNLNVQAATVLKTLMENRDPSWNETSVTVEDVYLQRRIELWGEGFSYFDLKRLNKGIDRTYSGTNHRTDGQIVIAAGDKRWIYQIPQTEIQDNSEISDEDNNK